MAEEGEVSNLHGCRIFRLFRRYLMPILQKCIIFAEFCFLSAGMASIPAVLQESL